MNVTADASTKPSPRQPPDVSPPALELGSQTVSLRRQLVDLLPTLRTFARHLGKNDHDEADLVHETVARALERFHHGDLRAWCQTVMYRCWMDELRHRSRHLAEVPELSVPPNQEHVVRALELERAIRQLDPHHRDALLALRYHGYSQEEAAERYGVTKNVIAGRAHRAEKKLRKRGKL